MILLELIPLLSSNASCIEWLMEIRLLAPLRRCPTCQDEMRLVDTTNVKDGKLWLCSKRTCKNKKLSIRLGSFFEKSKLSLPTLVLFIYLWSRGMSLLQIQTECEISEKTSIDWARFCRDIIMEHFANSNEIIGGLGRIVEIDESLVARRKYNRGRSIDQTWVFGGIERSDDSREYRAFIEIVERRDEETLLAVIRRRIAPGTLIMSDGWAAYRNLTLHGYQHQVVIHEENFVDPNDRMVHTQSIEGNWSVLKRMLRKKGTNLKGHLDEYLAEMMYRRRYFNVFEQFIRHVKEKYLF
jgi:transposase-like protein